MLTAEIESVSVVGIAGQVTRRSELQRFHIWEFHIMFKLVNQEGWNVI
jgi:hypothetical protein